jgi:dimethylargininase
VPKITAAIVRAPAANFGDGLSTAALGKPSYETALLQHAAYCEALRRAGVAVRELAPEPRFPDATFVEDVAVLLDALAILTRPGAATRRGEIETLRAPLAARFPSVAEIVAPGTLDGGDVCDAGDRFFIGISQRTNAAGAAQLAELLARAGKRCSIVDVRAIPGALHLKSAMAYAGDGRFVATAALAPHLGLSANRAIVTAPGEEDGANCVRVNAVVLLADGCPRLREQLDRAGYSVSILDVSEFRKMDGGLSCLSLRY